MPSEARARQVAKRIHEEISVLFQREVSDPRLINISVTDVKVDRELAFATIFVSTLQDDDREIILGALHGARGFFRSQLANRIPMRVFPRLRFRYDPTSAQGARIDELLAELREESASEEVPDGAPDGTPSGDEEL
jgi:ribosome-binding factor A